LQQLHVISTDKGLRLLSANLITETPTFRRLTRGRWEREGEEEEGGRGAERGEREKEGDELRILFYEVRTKYILIGDKP
jgi:hypothetical protein